jgi:hypothetical protein
VISKIETDQRAKCKGRWWWLWVVVNLGSTRWRTAWCFWWTVESHRAEKLRAVVWPAVARWLTAALRDKSINIPFWWSGICDWRILFSLLSVVVSGFYFFAIASGVEMFETLTKSESGYGIGGPKGNVISIRWFREVRRICFCEVCLILHEAFDREAKVFWIVAEVRPRLDWRLAHCRQYIWLKHTILDGREILVTVFWHEYVDKSYTLFPLTNEKL